MYTKLVRMRLRKFVTMSCVLDAQHPGAVISWGTPDFPSVHHPNLLTEAVGLVENVNTVPKLEGTGHTSGSQEESTRLIQHHGFRQDQDRLWVGDAELAWKKRQRGKMYRSLRGSCDPRQSCQSPNVGLTCQAALFQKVLWSASLTLLD